MVVSCLPENALECSQKKLSEKNVSWSTVYRHLTQVCYYSAVSIFYHYNLASMLNERNGVYWPSGPVHWSRFLMADQFISRLPFSKAINHKDNIVTGELIQ